MDSMKQYLDAIASNTRFSDALQEKTLTPAELKKREEIAKAIERENPDMPMGKKMAIATAKAKEVAEDVHYCAKHVYSEEFGEGLVVEGSHAEPDEAGLIEWYDVDFNGNVQRVMTEKVKVMHAEYHMNHKKKMKEEGHDDEAEDKAMIKKMVKKDCLSNEETEQVEEGMMDKLKSGAKKVANAVAPDDKTLMKKLAKDTGVKGTYHTITKQDIRNPNGPGKQVKVFVPTKEETELDEADDKGAWKKETPWVKKKPQKDEFGNPVKNVAKFLAKRAARKTAGDNPVKEETVNEGAVKQMMMDLEELSGEEFQAKYHMTKAEARKGLSSQPRENVKEAMISYNDFRSKMDMHRKAGSKIVDDKYDDKKAAYTVIDKEGVAKKITHTPTGMKQDHMGNVNGDDGADSKQTDKRGRGRPAGTKSGARH